jgi:hypothetical protein
MVSSGTLHRVTLVRIDVSEELSASFIRVTRIGELITLAATSNRPTLRRHTEDTILHSHLRENFKSYIAPVCLDVFWGIMPCGSSYNRRFGKHITSILSVYESGKTPNFYYRGITVDYPPHIRIVCKVLEYNRAAMSLRGAVKMEAI